MILFLIYLKVFLLLLLFAAYCSADPVDTLCEATFPVTKSSDTLYARYCSNVDLSMQDDTVTNAVFVLHGYARDALEHLQYVEAAGALTDGNVYGQTAIVAPQFITDEDLVAYGLEESDNLYWSSLGWRQGNTSNRRPYDRPFTISSFAVADDMLTFMASQYPNLETITVLGHSAGGQWVHRYAAGCSAQDLISGATFQHVVANPSSYMYFSGERAEAKSLDAFSVPDASTHLYGITGCPDYDDYKYGLNNLNSFMKSVGESNLVSNYDNRNVVIFLGENDTSREGAFDASCAGDLQGSNRYERGLIFFNHAVTVFGQQLTSRQKVKIAPGVGHTGFEMFTSPCGLLLLFDYDHTNDACPDFTSPAGETAVQISSTNYAGCITFLGGNATDGDLIGKLH